jgi:hypothetical protein
VILSTTNPTKLALSHEHRLLFSKAVRYQMVHLEQMVEPEAA